MSGLSGLVDVSIARLGESRLLGGPNTAWLDILGAEERERRSRLRFANDRNLFALAHVLLRTELSRHADVAPGDWSFTRGPHGKPSLTPDLMAAHGMHFSLSHAGETAVCAITRLAAVGADVEPSENDVDADALAAVVLTPAGRAALAALDASARQRRCLAPWTLKDAYAKARGVGLSLPMQQYGLDPSLADPPRLVHPAQERDEWAFDTAVRRADVLSAAVRRREAAPVSFRYRCSRIPGTTVTETRDCP